jgi:hypothetical protein
MARVTLFKAMFGTGAAALKDPRHQRISRAENSSFQPPGNALRKLCLLGRYGCSARIVNFAFQFGGRNYRFDFRSLIVGFFQRRFGVFVHNFVCWLRAFH